MINITGREISEIFWFPTGGGNGFWCYKSDSYAREHYVFLLLNPEE